MVKSETYSDIKTLFSKSQCDTRLSRQNDALKRETPLLITKDSEIWNQVKSFRDPQFARCHSVCILCYGRLNGWIYINTCTTLTQDFFLGNHQPEDNIFENLVTKRLLTTFHLTPILLVTHDKIFKILIVAMAVDHGTHSEQKRNIQCIFKFTFL